MGKLSVIRGAICAENTVESISESAVQLVGEILARNCLAAEQVTAVFFSVTADLDACYPAAAVRERLLPQAAFMNFQEMHVHGSLDHCIRVAVFAETQQVRHCYLGRARELRPDLHDSF